MNRTIENPYHVNWRLYLKIILLSLLTLGIGFYISTLCISEISEIVKNLSYGCVASTIVAWIIDCGNTKRDNQKANQIYDSAYLDLQIHISDYIGTWAQICSVAYGNQEYKEQAFTWMDWYKQTKANFEACTIERQEELIDFFCEKLQDSINSFNEAVGRLYLQYNILTINNVLDNNLKSILEDFRSEFYLVDLELYRKNGSSFFWRFLDVLNRGVYNCISEWKDIEAYNDIEFKPFEFVALNAARKASHE